MRALIAIAAGFLSAVLLFLLAGTAIGYTISGGASVAVAIAAVLAAWVVSAYFIRRNAATASVVLCRGFLLGAAEWLAMIPDIAGGLSKPAQFGTGHSGRGADPVG
jgi:hypothetical protein